MLFLCHLDWIRVARICRSSRVAFSKSLCYLDWDTSCKDITWSLGDTGIVFQYVAPSSWNGAQEAFLKTVDLEKLSYFNHSIGRTHG